MLNILGLVLTAAALTAPIIASPPRNVESEAMERAAAAIILRDELQIRMLLSSVVIYDPEFDDLRRLRGPDSATLDRLLREIKQCALRALMRSDAIVPTYTINWACRYRTDSEDRVAYDGAAAVLRWHNGKPTLANFNFQGPWATPFRVAD